jgi:uridine phosphorylase
MIFDEASFRYLFGCSYDDVPGDCLINPFWPLGYFRKHCGVEREYKGALFTMALAGAGEKCFGIVTCGIGSARAGDCVLFLKKAGVRRLVLTGPCGGIEPREKGDIIVAEGAYNGEGFSRYRAGGHTVKDILRRQSPFMCSGTLADRLYDTVRAGAPAGFAPERGMIYTTGSLFAETFEALKDLARSGVLGVEMEMSAVCSASIQSGISCGGIMAVSDVPGRRPFREKRTAENKRRYPRAVGAVISSAVAVVTS